MLARGPEALINAVLHIRHSTSQPTLPSSNFQRDTLKSVSNMEVGILMPSSAWESLQNISLPTIRRIRTTIIISPFHLNELLNFITFLF